MVGFGHEVPGNTGASLLDRHKQRFESFENEPSIPIRRTVSPSKLRHHIERKLQPRFLPAPSADWETVRHTDAPEKLAPAHTVFCAVVLSILVGLKGDVEGNAGTGLVTESSLVFPCLELIREARE